MPCSSRTATRITSSGSTRSAASTSCRAARSRATPRADVWDDIRRTFYYVFDGVPRQGGGIPKIDAHEIDGPFDVGRRQVVPVPLLHGSMPILGFRFGNFAYLTDCSAHPRRVVAARRRRRHAGDRRAARQAALDALHRGRGARRRSRGSRRGARTSRTWPTTWHMRRPTRACPPAWNWHMMASCSTSAVDAS